MKTKLSIPRFSSSAMLTRLSALLFQSTRFVAKCLSVRTRSPWRAANSSATSVSLFLLTITSRVPLATW